jgi:hypothetical protein
LKRIAAMRKRRLFLALGACLATVALTAGTALADPPTPPWPPVEIGGAQTTEGAFNDLCNNVIDDGTSAHNAVCGSWDVEGLPTVTTRDPAGPHPECANIHRPTQGGDGFTQLQVAALRACWDAARVVTAPDTTKTQYDWVALATDALTYAVRADGIVPLNLSIAQLKGIYDCSNVPTGVKPLIGQFGAGNRTLLFQKLGITDAANYTTTHPCVKDTINGQPILANDGRVLTDKGNLITYSSAPYFAQLNRIELDIHGPAVLGSINGIPPETLNSSSAIARTVYNIVHHEDITGTTTNPTIKNLFVGPSSQVCSNSTIIQQHGFSLTPLTPSGACGVVTNN